MIIEEELENVNNFMNGALKLQCGVKIIEMILK